MLSSHFHLSRIVMINVEISAKKKAISTSGPMDNAPRMNNGMNAPVRSQVIRCHHTVLLRRLKNAAIKPLTPTSSQSTSTNPGSGHKDVSGICACET